MANRSNYSQNIHNQVVRSSARTYTELIDQGYKVTINPGSEKNQWVDENEQLFPDVVVWKPNPQNPRKGTAIIIEEIETEDSVNQKESEQWLKYGKLQIDKFILIVPVKKVKEALELYPSCEVHLFGMKSFC